MTSLTLPTWTFIITLALVVTLPIYQIVKSRLARREAANLSRALSITYAAFTALEHIPDGMIHRDLRRGLVLLLTSYLDTLEAHNSSHPHLRTLRARVLKLNRIPSGMQRTNLRSKQARRHATLAFEEVASILKEGMRTKRVAQHDGALAYASAQFAAQQIAVENARQSAKDAENVRAYPQALNFAYQAQALCRKLPPLMSKALTDAVGQDIERLENLARRAA